MMPNWGAIPTDPLEVVQRRPTEIAVDIDAIFQRAGNGAQRTLEILHTAGIIGRGHAIFGHKNGDACYLRCMADGPADCLWVILLTIWFFSTPSPGEISPIPSGP